MNISKPIQWRTVAIGIVVLAVIVFFGRFAHEYVDAFERWIRSFGPWGPVAYIVVYVIVAPLGFSNVALGMLGGALFGLEWGLVAVMIGGLISESVMFVLGRGLFRNRVERFLEKHPKLSAFDTVASEQGVRFMILMRLSPLPYTLCCYLFALSRTTYLKYLLGFVGFIPGNAILVYLGFTLRHVAHVSDGSVPHSTLKTSLIIMTAVACVILLVYIARVAKQAVAKAEAEAL